MLFTGYFAKVFGTIGLGPTTLISPFKIFNIGSNKPVKLKKYVSIIEKNLNKKAKIIYKKKQPGDVIATNASNKKLRNFIKYSPKTKIEKDQYPQRQPARPYAIRIRKPSNTPKKTNKKSTNKKGSISPAPTGPTHRKKTKSKNIDK